MSVYERVKPYTMTSEDRVNALCREVWRVCSQGVRGAIVECGVWKGGSAMAAALTLVEAADDREIVLCDTFAGMPEPGQFDVDSNGSRAVDVMHSDGLVRAVCPLDEVRHNVGMTGYKNVRYVAGRVEETLPAAAPKKIAVLRLDTDWYESTRHCLRCLWPRVVPGGVLIVDDYGHWMGAKKAVDDFFGDDVEIERIDYTGVLIRKPA